MAVAGFKGFLNCGACFAWRGLVDLFHVILMSMAVSSVQGWIGLTPKPNEGISKPEFSLKVDERVNGRVIVAQLSAEFSIKS